MGSVFGAVAKASERIGDDLSEESGIGTIGADRPAPDRKRSEDHSVESDRKREAPVFVTQHGAVFLRHRDASSKGSTKARSDYSCVQVYVIGDREQPMVQACIDV